MLQVQQLSFKYQKEWVLQDISFSLEQGCVLAVMGESGCGKSTLLKLIYGLLDASSGAIFWEGLPVLGPLYHLVPGFPEFKYVAQDFDLMPHTTVSDNIGTFLSNIFLKEKQERIQQLLEVTGMEAFANEKVRNLSGGQQQRVAIAKALAKEPKLLLLDEPFSHIDNFKKNILRRDLFSYLKEKQIACIIATHDSNDTLAFANQMIILKGNRVIEQGKPSVIYKTPKTKYIGAIFDDINEIDLKVGQEREVRILRYPHQIFLKDKSPYKAMVKESYFRGDKWLIEAIYEYKSQKIFFSSPIPLNINNEIYFSFEM